MRRSPHHRRPRRSAADRRAQALRAEGRTCERLIRAFAELRGHRGGQPTLLGAALATPLEVRVASETQPEAKDPEGMPTEAGGTVKAPLSGTLIEEDAARSEVFSEEEPPRTAAQADETTKFTKIRDKSPCSHSSCILQA